MTHVCVSVCVYVSMYVYICTCLHVQMKKVLGLKLEFFEFENFRIVLKSGCILSSKKRDFSFQSHLVRETPRQQAGKRK